MPIIDVHAHFFPDSLAESAVNSVAEICDGYIVPALDGRLVSLEKRSEELGIERVVTLPVATKVEQVLSINRNLVRDNSFVVPFAALHPLMENFTEEIGFIVKSGVSGVKLHPEYQNFYITEKRFEPFWEALENSGLLVLMHCGYDPGPFSSDHATPEMVASLLDAFPSLKLIAAHFGGLQMWDDVEKWLIGRKVYLDTAAVASLLPADEFVRLARSHGVEKVLFGSDTPWEDQEKAITYIEECGLTKEEQELVLFTNAERLLKGEYAV